jgi:putative DNA primase/helicase
MPKTPFSSSGSPSDSKRARAGRKPSQPVTPPTAPAAGTRDDENFIHLMPTEGSGRSQNSISLPAKSGREQKDDRNRQEGRGSAGAAPQATKEAPRRLRVPDSVQERFIQIGNKFHFPDGTEAFTHDSNRLTTRSENSVVIQSMVAIARENGKGPVTVGGTEFFKKEAWFAASLAGLEVSGYEPTDFERERLVRALAARRVPGAPEASELAPAAAAASEEERPAPKAAGEGRAADGLPKSNDMIVGRLVDHGAAPYGHDPKQAISYFVRVETARGYREIWGVDLERAFRQSLSTPGIGDEIGVRSVGRQPVTVLAPKLDAQGRETGQAPLDTHRNQWIVERKDFLDERQRIAEVLRNRDMPAADGIRRHPELEGSYMQLQMGRALAEQQFRDKAQREQFVDHLRSHIARRIEFGQPLDPVMLRGEERTVAPRSQDRDFQPTR